MSCESTQLHWEGPLFSSTDCVCHLLCQQLLVSPTGSIWGHPESFLARPKASPQVYVRSILTLLSSGTNFPWFALWHPLWSTSLSFAHSFSSTHCQVPFPIALITISKTRHLSRAWSWRSLSPCASDLRPPFDLKRDTTERSAVDRIFPYAHGTLPRSCSSQYCVQRAEYQ